jgi:flagellar biosynthesis GTPase FlhF
VARESRTEDGITLVVDVDKVVTGVKEHNKGLGAFVRSLMEKKGAKLSPDEDKELDDKIGVKDGGPIDKVLDKATGVDEADDEHDDEDEKREKRERRERREGKERREEETEEEDEAEEADDEGLDEKVKSKLRAERAKRKEAERERDRALKIAERATSRRKTLEDAQLADAVLDDMKIPDSYRERLRYELTGRDLTEAEMRTHVKGFDLAFIRPLAESAGVPVGQYAGAGGTKPKFDFKRGN